MGTLIRGGLWQRHCEKALHAAGFHPLYYPECWPSMFWHPVLDFYLEFMLTTLRCQDQQKTLRQGGNTSPPKLIWKYQRTLDVILVVNVFSTMMSNLDKSDHLVPVSDHQCVV